MHFLCKHSFHQVLYRLRERSRSFCHVHGRALGGAVVPAGRRPEGGVPYLRGGAPPRAGGPLTHVHAGDCRVTDSPRR